MDPYDTESASSLVSNDETETRVSHRAVRLNNPADSPEALEALNVLPSASQQIIRSLLQGGETLKFVEKPSRWRAVFLQKHPLNSLFEGRKVPILIKDPFRLTFDSKWTWCCVGNIVLILASVLGTIVFLTLLIFKDKINSNILIVLAVFPLSLILTAYSIYRGEQRFFVLTDRRLLCKPGWGSTLAIDLKRLVAVSLRFNWLMLMQELEIKHEITGVSNSRQSRLSNTLKRTKVDYVDSVTQLQMYLDYLESKIVSSDPEDEDL